MRVVALEEHHASSGYLESVAPELRQHHDLARRLVDVGEDRITAMDEAGIDVQVLSLATPGVEQLDAGTAISVATDENDYRGEAVRAYPSRFAGFATLPIAAPDAAAAELERTVNEYGFVGALINGHARGHYLDDPVFRPILERAEALGVPIYMHPAPSPQPVIDTWYSGFTSTVTARLSTWAWGWHIETAVHVLRLVVGGVFDRYPNLQIIVGHLGEGLVSMMARVNVGLPPDVTGLDRSPGEYLRDNISYTTSGFNYESVFLDLMLQVGTERIMFSTDYPNWPMRQSRQFLEQLPLSPKDKHLIAHGNAERLLRIQPNPA